MPVLVNLSREEFEHALQAFVLKANAVSSDFPWHVKTVPVSNATYAVRKQTCLLGHSSSLCTDTDDEAALSLPMADTVTAEYHVLYSPTYRVPVLYFNAYYADGSPLPRTELEQHVFSSIHVDALKKSSLIHQGAISQHDHPLLNLPFYFIHPCDTASLMAQLHMPEATSYIASWISFFGPPVGLRINSTHFIDGPTNNDR